MRSLDQMNAAREPTMTTTKSVTRNMA